MAWAALPPTEKRNKEKTNVPNTQAADEQGDDPGWGDSLKDQLCVGLHGMAERSLNSVTLFLLG